MKNTEKVFKKRALMKKFRYLHKLDIFCSVSDKIPTSELNSRYTTTYYTISFYEDHIFMFTRSKCSAYGEIFRQPRYFPPILSTVCLTKYFSLTRISVRTKFS